MIAAFVGAAAAYLGGLAEKIILEVIHFLLVVPSFLILALVSQRAHGDWPVLILVLTVFGWMFNARVVWSLTTSLREREYVQAARYMGVGRIRIVVRHLIPNLGSLLIVSFTLGVVATVQAETALSFIGFGVQPPDVSLGTMLSDGANTVSSAPWLFFVPAALVTLLTVSMALIGDGLRDALDPTSRSGRPGVSTPGACRSATCGSPSRPRPAGWTRSAASTSTCCRAGRWASSASPARASRSPRWRSWACSRSYAAVSGSITLNGPGTARASTTGSCRRSAAASSA